MKAVAIVTARGGSKGVPGKNLRPVGGVSLVGRAIQAATGAGCFDRIVLTTDSPEIAAEGARHGALCLDRPARLADDGAKSIDAVLDALDQLGACGESFDLCVLLQPTSPLRTAFDIRQAVDRFVELKTGSLFSVCACEHHPLKAMLLQDGELVAVRAPALLEAPRQSLPVAFRPNGAIYVNRVEDLRRAHSFFVQPFHFVEMDAKRSLDIDSEADLVLANQFVQETDHAS